MDNFVSRDLDSLFSHREQAAVEEWLKSEKYFHIMRDHPAHDEVILAGLWVPNCQMTKLEPSGRKPGLLPMMIKYFGQEETHMDLIRSFY